MKARVRLNQLRGRSLTGRERRSMDKAGHKEYKYSRFTKTNLENPVNRSDGTRAWNSGAAVNSLRKKVY